MRERYRSWRGRQALACVRCGKGAAGTCLACQALVCADCAVLSIETGFAAVLCRSCSGGRAAPGPPLRSRAPHVFRAGASILVGLLAAMAALASWRHGWSGLWGLARLMIEPAVLLGLIPAALLLGAIRLALLRLVGSGVERTRRRRY